MQSPKSRSMDRRISGAHGAKKKPEAKARALEWLLIKKQDQWLQQEPPLVFTVPAEQQSAVLGFSQLEHLPLSSLLAQLLRVRPVMTRARVASAFMEWNERGVVGR